MALWVHYRLDMDALIRTAELMQAVCDHSIQELQADATLDAWAENDPNAAEERRKEAQAQTDYFRSLRRAYGRTLGDWLKEYEANGQATCWYNRETEQILRHSTSEGGLAYIVSSLDNDGTGNGGPTRHGAAWDIVRILAAEEALENMGDVGMAIRAKVEIALPENGATNTTFITFEVVGETLQEVREQVQQLRIMFHEPRDGQAVLAGMSKAREAAQENGDLFPPVPTGQQPGTQQEALARKPEPPKGAPQTPPSGELPRTADGAWPTVRREAWGSVVQMGKDKNDVWFDASGYPYAVNERNEWQAMKATEHPTYGFSWFCPWRDQQGDWIKFRIRIADLRRV